MKTFKLNNEPIDIQLTHQINQLKRYYGSENFMLSLDHWLKESSVIRKQIDFLTAKQLYDAYYSQIDIHCLNLINTYGVVSIEYFIDTYMRGAA